MMHEKYRLCYIILVSASSLNCTWDLSIYIENPLALAEVLLLLHHSYTKAILIGDSSTTRDSSP